MTDSRPYLDEQPCSPQLWDAMRYLSGELSSEESAAFEDRLADDLALSDALANAVRMQAALDAVAAAPDVARPLLPVVSSVLPVPRRTLQWAAAGICAAGLLLLGWYAGERGGSAVSDASSQSPSGSPVSISAANVAGGDLESMLSVWVELDGARLQPTDDESAEDAEAINATSDIPEWMFAALLTPTDPANAVPDGIIPDLDELMEDSL